jgi:hypothetical protein
LVHPACAGGDNEVWMQNMLEVHVLPMPGDMPYSICNLLWSIVTSL